MGPNRGIPETEHECIRHLIHRLSQGKILVDIPFRAEDELEENKFFVVYPNGKEFKITVEAGRKRGEND